jgi:hypothetical protein
MARTENLQPRRQLLDIWKAAATYSYVGKHWRWGGMQEANSISDAEQLLTILLPATSLTELSLEDPDDTAEDVIDVLGPTFGDSVNIPRVLVQTLDQYLERYTAEGGSPVFSGGSYFHPLDPEAQLTDDQLNLDVVVSHATSVTLCLSALGFLDVYANAPTTRGVWRAKVLDVRDRTSVRLTAALAGLLRGFTMNPLDTASTEGMNLIATLNRDGLPVRRVIDQFNDRMETVRGRLSEARMGVARADELDNPNVLFEVGWTWGIAENAPPIALDDADAAAAIGPQRDGVALSAPYLYFTTIALDAIEQLTSDRTRVLGLLNPQQERLATSLGVRRDLTQRYWSRLARFGSGTTGNWPVEDMPWRTADGIESDYFSLLVCAVVTQDFVQRTNANEDELRRIAPLLSELANRARITRRHLRGDQMLELHSPGLLNALDGADKLGPAMGWRITDFAPLLLKRVVQFARLTTDADVRDTLLSLASHIWSHLSQRRLLDGTASGLWDDPARVFSEVGTSRTMPSWNMTIRVADALVAAADTLVKRQTRTPALSQQASSMVSEAEWLLNQQLMATPSINSPLQNALQEIRDSLQRAKGLVDTQPSVAIALCVHAVTQLDKNTLARADVSQGL